MQLLFEGLLEELPNKINDLNTLRYKIEKWWILNIQIPTSDDFTADNPPKEKDIITFSQIINQVILDLLSGDEIKANYYKQEFEKRFK